MGRLITDIDGVLDLESQLLNPGTGSTGGCCTLGTDHLQSGLVDIPEPSDEEQLLAEQSVEESLDSVKRRMYATMQDTNFSAEDMIIYAKIAKDNQLHMDNAPAISVALMNKLSNMLSRPTNNSRDLLLLEQSKLLLREAAEPLLCAEELHRDLLVHTHTFDDFGAVVLENI